MEHTVRHGGPGPAQARAPATDSDRDAGRTVVATPKKRSPAGKPDVQRPGRKNASKRWRIACATSQSPGRGRVTGGECGDFGADLRTAGDAGCGSLRKIPHHVSFTGIATLGQR